MAEESKQLPSPIAEKEINWIKKDPQELRVFFFIATRPLPGPTPQNPQEIVNSFFTPPKFEKRIIWAFEFVLEKAVEVAKSKAPEFANFEYTNQNPTVKEFLAEGRLSDFDSFATIQKEKEKAPEKLSLPQLNFDQFKAGLLFMANETIIIYQNPEDRETLKRIIQTLKYAPKP